MSDLVHIARLLGGEAHADTIRFPTPGHSASDRGSVATFDPEAPNGVLVNSFNGDGAETKRVVLGTIRMFDFAGDQPRAFREPQSSFAEHMEPAEKTKGAMKLWLEARPARGSIVEAYLASRGLLLPLSVVEADAIRFHPNCPFGGQTHPAMLAVMRDTVTDETRALHRTALRSDGSGKAELGPGKSSKMFLGSTKGAVIKLSRGEDVTTGLGVAEGIENALTVLCRGWSPVWAAGSAGALAKFPVLAGVEAITIFADPEKTGQASARDCALRWQAGGREATIISPPSDDDWNKWNETTWTI